MKIELTHITPNPDVFIGKAASECYDGATDDETCRRRTMKAVGNTHLAVLRFAHASFHVSGVSRVFSHQVVRHKFLDYLQRSQRYCDETDVDCIVPPSIVDAGMEDEFREFFQQAKNLYGKLRSHGVAKEDARYVLPQAATTSMAITGSFQAWHDFLGLRDDKAAQWEIRNMAKQVRAALGEHSVVFK